MLDHAVTMANHPNSSQVILITYIAQSVLSSIITYNSFILFTSNMIVIVIKFWLNSKTIVL